MSTATVATAPTTALETLVSGFWRQVDERPNEPAMHSAMGSRYYPITWKQFGDSVERVAAFLLERGVADHSFVAIWSNNRPEWHIADMAILSLRCRPVPIYQTVSEEQASYILNHSESVAIFVENDVLLEHVLAVRGSVPSLTTVVVFDHAEHETLPEGVITWATLQKDAEKLVEKHRPAFEKRKEQVTLDDFATLIYTSGTTGPPKAVCLSHKNVSAAQQSIAGVVRTTPEDRILSYLPLAHIAERDVSEFRSYLTGCQVYFLDSFPKLAERLKLVRPTQFLGVPRVWEKMGEQIRKKVSSGTGITGAVGSWGLHVANKWTEAKCGSTSPGVVLELQHRLAAKLVYTKIKEELGFQDTRVFASGAAPISLDVLKFFYGIGIEIDEVYGQTENTAICCMSHPGAAVLGTVGPPFPHVEVKLAEDGEILCKADNVFVGYYKDDAATSETLIDGWLHTGDIGSFDEEGRLRITDRKKDLIITAGGKNISPTNIELSLALDPLIGHAVVIGDKRPFISALITLDPEEAPLWAKQHGVNNPDDLDALTTNEDIHKAIQRRVDIVNASLNHAEQVKRWAVLPRDFTIGDELTPTLKVKRKVVNDKYQETISSLYSGHE
ncbi:MAG: AMP-dependent synthetase/ligase [Candidatus Dormibacteria bacterium]